MSKKEETIQVTPQMIEAGVKVLCNSGISDEYLGADTLLVEQIYRAMYSVHPGAVGWHETKTRSRTEK